MSDLISVGIASIPSREHSLKKAVDSLYDNANEIHVFLNRYSAVPDFLNKPKINVYRSQVLVDMGDAGKMFKVASCKGYYFSCDDDLVYPADYIDKMVTAIEKYHRKAVVGIHGSVWNSSNPAKFYGDRTCCPFGRELKEDYACHMLGTGCCAWHTSTIKLAFENFEIANMADLWMAIQAQKQRVPMISVARPNNWVEQSDIDFKTSIFGTAPAASDMHNSIVSSITWNLFSKPEIKNV